MARTLDTNFVDERGCAHTAQVAALVRLHLAGILIYDEGVAKDRARAKALLQQVGDKAESTKTRCLTARKPQWSGIGF